MIMGIRVANVVSRTSGFGLVMTTEILAETPKKMSAKGDLAAMMAARRKAQATLNVPLPMAPDVTAQGST